MSFQRARIDLFLHPDVFNPVSFLNRSIQVVVLTETVSLHVLETSYKSLPVLVDQLPVRRVVFVKSSLKKSSLLECKKPLSVLLQILVQSPFVNISVRVLNDGLTYDLVVLPESLQFVAFIRETVGNVLSISYSFAFLPMPDKFIFGHLCKLSNSILFTLPPFTNKLLSGFVFSLTISTHLFTG